MLASPLLHVGVLATMLPVVNPPSAPPTFVVVWFANIPVPFLPALSPFTSTFIS